MILLYSPIPPDCAADQKPLRRLDGLSGKVVGFIDNSKPNFNYLVDDLAELMTGRFGVKSTILHRKRVPGTAASQEVMKDLAAQCDLVITGSGD